MVGPEKQCKVLADEVVPVDSPGTDVEADLDELSKKFCLDLDVFVLVANSESNLDVFPKVAEILSNPNLVIIRNDSDAFALEDIQSEVKENRQYAQGTGKRNPQD